MLIFRSVGMNVSRYFWFGEIDVSLYFWWLKFVGSLGGNGPRRAARLGRSLEWSVGWIGILLTSWTDRGSFGL